MDNLAYDYSEEELESYDDEEDYELIGGEKFMMAPAPTPIHGTIAGKIYTFFANYIITRNARAAVFGDNTDVFLSNKDHFKPDVSVVCDPNVIVWNKAIIGVPDLVVEVLSESTMKNDLGRKKDAYEKYGVREYWIVDPWSQRIDVYLLENNKFTSGGIYKVQTKDTELKSEIKVSIFDDLTIDLCKVFKRWFDD